MTLPSSPPISLTQIYTEFGAPLGTPLSQFYQGGPWVGVGGANANVPTKPPIGLLNLLGAAAGGTTSGFIATLNFSSISIQKNSGLYQTPPIVCSTTGGTGAVTFQWRLVSGDTSVSIDSPTSASTTFSLQVISPPYSSVFQCTATDSASHVTQSNIFTLSIAQTGPRGSGRFAPP